MSRALFKHPFLAVVILAAMVCSTVSGPSVLAINPQPEPPGISVWVDNQRLELETAPIIESGRTLVPMRAIFEKLGASVNWDGATKKVTAKKGDTTLVLIIGSSTAYKNGAAIQLDVSPRIENGYTLVPLRFVGEALGATADWDGSSRKVNIKSAVFAGRVTTLPVTDQVVRKKLEPGANLGQVPKGANLSTGINYSKKLDSDAIQRSAAMARAIKPGEILTAVPPSRMDFSKYVTFVGSQDGWGGCIGRSIVQVMNILNEREHPYTPDLSFWYLHARQMQLFPGDPEPDTKFQLESEGLCSEASLPTDYDPLKVVNGENDWDDMQWPSMGNYIEAKALYRVLYPDEPITPEVETMKSLMFKYGPLMAGGPFVIIQGENPSENHCITIIGYDDDTRVFSCLNSWGDQKHGGDGIFELPYDQLEENVNWVRYIKDLPSHRESTSHAYTGRISLEGQYAYRSGLTIKVGVEGLEPVTIWSTPNQVQCKDYSYDLCLDFALPEYAAQHWPPSGDRRWYVEIKNDNPVWAPEGQEPTDGIFTVKEFTLARLYKKDNGSLDTETFSAEGSVGKTVKDGVTKIYIPAVRTVIKPNDKPQIILTKPELPKLEIAP